MTTLVKTWTRSINNAVVNTLTAQQQGQLVAKAIWDHYKAAGWTVEGSSNGTAASMDGTDRLLLTTDFVYAAAGAAHSWGVLKSPYSTAPLRLLPNTTKRLYLSISTGVGATTYHNILFNWSSSAFTGTSVTVDPTTSNGRAFTKQTIGVATTGAVASAKYHSIRSNYGDALFWTSLDGTGMAQHANGCISTANYEAGDEYGALCVATYNSTAPGALLVTNLYSSSHTASFWNDGTVLTTAGICQLFLAGSDQMGSVTSGGSNITANWPDAPAILATQDASKIAFRGYLQDFALAPKGAGVVQGTLEPASGAATCSVLGNFWVPSGATQPTY